MCNVRDISALATECYRFYNNFASELCETAIPLCVDVGKGLTAISKNALFSLRFKNM